MNGPEFPISLLHRYRSVKHTFVTLLLMFMGQFDLHEFLNNAPVFGAILFFTYMIVITMILINLFVGIICDVFAAVDEVRDAEEEEREEQEKAGGGEPSVLPMLFHAITNIRSKEGKGDHNIA